MVVQQALFGNFNDEIADFLASGSTPQQIIAFRPSSAFQQRTSELLALNCNGQLTAQDRAELDDLTWIEDFMRVMKAKSRSYIKP